MSTVNPEKIERVSPLVTFLQHPLLRAVLALSGVLALGFVYHGDGAFRQWGTHRDMLRSVSEYAILACGMTLVIVTGGIDLAVGSILALSAVIFSKLSIHYQWHPVMAVPAALCAGMLCGLTSGVLVACFRIQAFIATLAMMVFARGFSKFISQGQKVSTTVQTADGNFENRELPGIFELLGSRVFNDNVAVVSIVFLFCLAISWFVLSKLRWGRYLYAIGGNEEATRLSGAPVAISKLLAYGMSGLFAAVAGILHAAQETQGDPDAGNAYELTAIAMVVIGGTSLAGGRGGVGLTLVGALTIGYLEKVLSINAVAEANRLMLTGAIIIGAVLFQRSRRR